MLTTTRDWTAAQRGDTWVVCDGDGLVLFVELTKGEAHLIVAAPQLLAALLGVMDASMVVGECPHDEEPDYCDGCTFDREKRIGKAMEVARAAVAAAEGR